MSSFIVGKVGSSLFVEFIIALAVPMLMVFNQCEKRKYFYLRLVPLLAGFIVASYFQPTILLWRRWYFGFLLDFLLLLALMEFCYKIPINSLFFYGAAAWCVQHIFARSNSVVEYFARQNHVDRIFYDTTITYMRETIMFAFIIVIFYVFFMRDFVFQFNFMKKGRRRMFFFSTFSIVIVYAISNLALTKGALFNIYILTYDIICCCLFLYIIFFMNKLNNHEMQRYVLDELQKQDSKQQVMRKENYETIAIRYHDLSKQLALLEMEEKSKSRQHLIQEVKGELDNFAALVQTGNKALDIVLTDKKMICMKYDIKLFTKVNEHVLDFMDEVDVYTIFSNLFDNAIESLRNEEKENKVIKLNIHQKDSLISVDCQNYTSKEIIFKDNMPQTTKDDQTLHGYGTLSIKKAVKKYHGSVIYRLDDNIFHAYIMLQNNHGSTPKETAITEGNSL